MGSILNGNASFETQSVALANYPIIQSLYDSQSYNRYTYVFNNPLSLTDPSGYASWWVRDGRGAVKAIVAVVVAYFTGVWVGGEVISAYGATAGATGTAVTMSSGIGTLTVAQVAGAAGAAAGGFAAGGIMGGNIQSALRGAFFAALTFGVAEAAGLHGSAIVDGALDTAKYIKQIALHAAIGCAQSAAAGGHCKDGALGGAVGAIASPGLDFVEKGLAKAIASGIIGGLASSAAGGKFENGFISAAFGYL
jgi:hypothetical protein